MTSVTCLLPRRHSFSAVATLAAAGDFVVRGRSGVDYLQMGAAAGSAGEAALAGGGGWPFFAFGLLVCHGHVLPFHGLLVYHFRIRSSWV